MNYIEVGLPHTEFVPTKKEFTPRRPVPLSGLGKKYLGLETLNKTEIDSLVNRLAQPKIRDPQQWQRTRELRARSAMDNDNKRFTGKKRMSSSDLKSMIDRLAKGRNDRTPEASRVSSKEDENVRGVTRSYAWQGKNVSKYLRNEIRPVNIERLEDIRNGNY